MSSLPKKIKKEKVKMLDRPLKAHLDSCENLEGEKDLPRKKVNLRLERNFRASKK